MLIGLISVYDVYFSALLRAAAGKEAKAFLTDDKTIRLSDLNAFSSIEEAKESLIQGELDSVLRSSLTDQLDWCQKHFKFEPSLKSYLPHWPEFVEIFARLQSDKSFQEAFRKIFKESLIRFDVNPPQEETKPTVEGARLKKSEKKSQAPTKRSIH
jgi:hypothetical protein